MAHKPTILIAFWSFVGANYAFAFAAAGWTGLQIDYSGFAALLLPLATAFAMLSALARFRDMPKVVVLTDIVFSGAAMTVPALVSTYAAAKVGMPLADGTLVGMDTALGVDWTSTIHAVDGNAVLSKVLEWSYQSFTLQLLIIPMILVALDQPRRAYIFVASFGLIGMISSLISVWFPALGTYEFYGIDPSGLANINPHFGYHFLAQFNAVRGDATFVLTLADAAGIVTFPSVHAAAAALCAWGGWNIPAARWGLLPLNAAMAISAFTHANHYAVDILAGIAIATACVLGVSAVADRFGRQRLGHAARAAA